MGGILKFYKYRRTWSSSPGTWEYIRLPEGETPKSFFHEMAREYSWSEHFRGIDYKKVKHPPKAWLEKQVNDLAREAWSSNQLAGEYMSLLKELK